MIVIYVVNKAAVVAEVEVVHHLRLLVVILAEQVAKILIRELVVITTQAIVTAR